MDPNPRTTPRGFTLVELLMVIIIIGILAGLLIVAVGPTLGTVNNAVVKTEIDQMDLALNNYRNTYGALPPTLYPTNHGTQMGVFAISATDAGTKQDGKIARFERHVRKAFPRYAGNWTIAGTDLATGTEFPTGASYGGVTACDLTTMDPAEALVFWLGGIPKIWKADLAAGEYEVELTGFAQDPSNPFLPEYDPPSGGDFQSNRTPPLFEFDPRRLVDTDQDGWPEYVPDTGAAQGTPPYAYFHSSTYTELPFYPASDHGSLGTWGLARPYLIRYQPSATEMPIDSSFANSETFQIICAGADNQYGEPVTSATILTAITKLPVYPEGLNYNIASSPATKGPTLSAIEFDNLTNFTDSALENDIED